MFFKFENKECVIIINKLWLIHTQTCHHPLDLAPPYASFVSPQHPTVFFLYQSINLSSSQSHGELFDALSSNEDTERLNTRYMCLRRDTLCSAPLLIVNVVSALFNEICASRPLLSYDRRVCCYKQPWQNSRDKHRAICNDFCYNLPYTFIILLDMYG